MANTGLLKLEGDSRIAAASKRLDLSRREFLQFCTTVAASLGLPQGADAAVAEAIADKKRPSVIWLQFQECTGCTESMLRSEHPTLEKLILDVISLDYHETLFAAAGHQAEQARRTAMAENKNSYLLVIEGAIPTRDGGIYCKVGGQTAVELTQACAADAAAVIARCGCCHRHWFLCELGWHAIDRSQPDGFFRRRHGPRQAGRDDSWLPTQSL